jgi:hypothetical protein
MIKNPTDSKARNLGETGSMETKTGTNRHPQVETIEMNLATESQGFPFGLFVKDKNKCPGVSHQPSVSVILLVGLGSQAYYVHGAIQWTVWFE